MTTSAADRDPERDRAEPELTAGMAERVVGYAADATSRLPRCTDAAGIGAIAVAFRPVGHRRSPTPVLDPEGRRFPASISARHG